MIKKYIPNAIKKKIKEVIHKGDKYTCPFCGYNSKDLAMTGTDLPVLKEKQVVGGGRRAAGCFKCGSNDRERLIYVYLKEIYKIQDKPKGLRVLHIAPERHLMKELLKEGLSDYICGDKFTEGYTYPQNVKNMDILDLPFEAKSFDLIICNHVLEHIPNDLDAMKALYEVLDTGGQSILQVPISKKAKNTIEDFTVVEPAERERNFGQFDHMRLYGQDYTKRLEKAGFNVKRIKLAEDYPQYGLNYNEELFIGYK